MDDEYSRLFDRDTYGIDGEFIARINQSFPLPDLEKVQKQIIAIGGDIDQLETKIQAILNFQYNEYVTAFGKFMDSVRLKLREKIEEMEQREKEYQKKNDIQIIKTERDFFRKEAVRLNGLCKDMSKKIEEMAFNMKLLSGELNIMTTKWKESENINKQLLVELESNIEAMKEVEKENTDLKEKNTKVNLLTTNNNNNNMRGEYIRDQMNQNESNIEVEKMNYIVERIKLDLKKERERHQKTINELNKIILDKHKLESIFVDCVEEMRKEIFNRKLKETIDNGYNKKFMSQTAKDKEVIKIPYVSDIKYDKFLPSDKKKLLKEYILKDEVMAVFHDILFNKVKKEAECMQMLKGISILNENRISPNEPLSQTRNVFNKPKFTFSGSVGKTHQNFAKGIKFKSFKPINY